MTKPRKQIFTMDQYNKDIKDEDIRQDPDVQRVGGDQWSKEMVNELIFTTLNGDYVPPIIIGEENNSQKWIIDGLQRTTSWFIFRYGNYKITKSIEESVVNYKRKCRTEDGRIMKDEHGDIIWENAEFDIKGKTYSDLPDELKKSFNEYQVETVIHENCTMERISKLIRRYNNHVSMNSNQKAFTYVDNFARMIRDITKHTFFVNCGEYSQKSKTKGVLERVIVETIACMYHFDNWKRDVKRLNSYINKNATRVEFEKFRNNLDNLANIVTDEVKNLFTVKDSFIWFTAYNNAIESGIKDEEFGRFLKKFNKELKFKEVDGICFETFDKEKGTKDKFVIETKLKIISSLLNDFIQPVETINVLDFLRENVDENILEEDIEYYKDDLEVLSLDIDNNTRILDISNTPSLLAMIAYSYKEDKPLDHWFVNYCGLNNTYIENQKTNYLHMKEDFEHYLEEEVA